MKGRGGEKKKGQLGMSMVVCWARKGLTECYQFHNKVNFLLELIFHQKENWEWKSPAGDNQHQTTLKGRVPFLYFTLLSTCTTLYQPPTPHPNHHRFIKFPLQFSFIFFCSIFLRWPPAFFFATISSLTPRIFVSCKKKYNTQQKGGQKLYTLQRDLNLWNKPTANNNQPILFYFFYQRTNRIRLLVLPVSLHSEHV